MSYKEPVQGSSPHVRELFRIIAAENRTVNAVALKAGVEPQSIYRWRMGKKPFLDNFEAVLNTMGYELVILPMAKPFNED